MELLDKEFGRVVLKPNARARRVIARVREGVLCITHPVGVPLTDVTNAIEEMRIGIRKLYANSNQAHVFQDGDNIKTNSFQVYIQKNNCNKLYAQLKNGILSITYPHLVEIENEELQARIRKIVETAMRAEAKRLLPNRIEYLAEKYKFNYLSLKINSSQTRWGSCSMAKSINLSYHCMILPDYLLDFVILHELCHTKEMNHSSRFWTLLDNVSEGKSIEYTKELKQYNTRW